MGARGGIRGFVTEVSGLAGLLLGLALIRSFFSPAVRWLDALIPPYAAPAVAFVSLILAGMLAVGILTALLRRVLKISFAVWLDRLLGCGTGLFKGVLLTALLACGAAFLVPHFPQVRDSQAVPRLLELARWCGAALGVVLPSPLSPAP
jgi:uncharacterized membrane protein required for colicin V production